MHLMQPDGWRKPVGYANGMSARGRTVFVGGQIANSQISSSGAEDACIADAVMMSKRFGLRGHIGLLRFGDQWQMIFFSGINLIENAAYVAELTGKGATLRNDSNFSPPRSAPSTTLTM